MLDKKKNDKYSLTRSETSDEGVVFTLTVTDVTEDDLGMYTCISAGHPDHVLQETSMFILGEGLAFNWVQVDYQ